MAHSGSQRNLVGAAQSNALNGFGNSCDASIGARRSACLRMVSRQLPASFFVRRSRIPEWTAVLRRHRMGNLRCRIPADHPVFDERSRCPARRHPAKPDRHLPNCMASIRTTSGSMSCNASDSIRQTASTNARPAAGRRSSPTSRCAPLAPASPLGRANAAE